MSRKSTQIMRKYGIKEEGGEVSGGLNRCKAVVKQVSIENSKMTPEQIENWRLILTMQLGPYALIMRPEEIQKHRDILQKYVNEL